MAINFQAVCNSEEARDALFCIWYNDALQEEAKHILTLGWWGNGFANSGTDQVIEWMGMYFFLGDDGHVEEGPFNSLEEVLDLPYLRRSITGRRDLHSKVLPLGRLIGIAHFLVEAEGEKIEINGKRFVLSGGELLEDI